MTREFFTPNDGGGIGFQHQLRKLQIDDTHKRLTSTLERVKPAPDTVDALYSLATSWHAGVDFDSHETTAKDKALMRASLRALSHHARTEYVSTVSNRLIQVSSRFIETPQEVNVSDNEVKPPFGVGTKGLLEIFKFMSEECQFALKSGTQAGVNDLCTALQHEDVSLFDAAATPISEISGPIQIGLNKKIHTLPTAITGVDMKYVYGEREVYPRLSLVINPL